MTAPAIHALLDGAESPGLEEADGELVEVVDWTVVLLGIEDVKEVAMGTC